ncbi:HAF repeat-containing protein [Massilia sp. PAMC28688]|uniref:HAF repeat-containing protein n=1 Tax=Massilia sp. PAMC28688 TaxID=2861283 RepID=UPI001C6385F7|nr:HAF repeat-containing protein [Massilia sp. PAMC28688]QYF95113.1 HAF repeat-containing protein [Massilia sp. PAMC28688]
MPALHQSLCALIAAAALGLLPMPAQAGPRYTITALPPGTSVSAINEQGQIAGSVGTPDGPRAYLWSAGALFDIPVLNQTDASLATSVNGSGAVSGYAVLASGERRAFTYASGALTELDIFGAGDHYAQAIGSSGDVVGAYVREGNLRAYVYRNGVATDLGTLGDSFATATGINSAGHVVGFSGLDDGQPLLAHAFLYADGVMTDLGTMAGASLSEATAINDRGQITGHGWVQGSHHAFLYQQGVMRDLGTLGGRYSFAYDINSAGQIVGWSNAPGDEAAFAFLYDGSSMLDLNTLIDPASGWILHEARGINDRQQIAAFGCRGEVCGAVLLEPAAIAVAEPATLMLMLCALALLGLGGIGRASAAYRCA